MRVADDLRKAVLFIGIETPDGKFESAGTAFLCGYKRSRYLVTAQHVARELADVPFALRANKSDGSADNITVDLADPEQAALFKWHSHEDETVDLAVAPFNWNLRQMGYEVLHLPEEIILSDADLVEHNIGTGDVCYAVGLFRLMAGKQRNLPIVHTGNVALMPGEERVPVKNWRGRGTVLVDGYLVELTNLDGLSGSPVFVRPLITQGLMTWPQGAISNARLISPQLLLLGVWQASWDGEPTAVRPGSGPVRVPVGIGTVVPSMRLLEILEGPAVAAEREAFLARQEAGGATNSGAAADA